MKIDGSFYFCLIVHIKRGGVFLKSSKVMQLSQSFEGQSRFLTFHGTETR